MTAALAPWLSTTDAAPLLGRCVDRTRRAFGSRVHAHRPRECRSVQWFALEDVVRAARRGADLPAQIEVCAWCSKDPACPPPPRLAGRARRSRASS